LPYSVDCANVARVDEERTRQAESNNTMSDTLQQAAENGLKALEIVTRHFTKTPSTLKDSEARGTAHSAMKELRLALAAQPKAQEPLPIIELVHQAVARGWCSNRNANKEMDADLILDISDEVMKMLAEVPKEKP
jgi:hypothetical protein